MKKAKVLKTIETIKENLLHRIEIFSKPQRYTIDDIEAILKPYIKDNSELNTVICKIIDYEMVCESNAALLTLLRIEEKINE